MNGKLFKEIWEELEDFPFDEVDGVMVLAKDFYHIAEGSTNEEVWSELKQTFNGLVIGEVLNNQEGWEEEYGSLLANNSSEYYEELLEYEEYFGNDSSAYIDNRNEIQTFVEDEMFSTLTDTQIDTLKANLVFFLKQVR